MSDAQLGDNTLRITELELDSNHINDDCLKLADVVADPADLINDQDGTALFVEPKAILTHTVRVGRRTGRVMTIYNNGVEAGHLDFFGEGGTKTENVRLRDMRPGWNKIRIVADAVNGPTFFNSGTCRVMIGNRKVIDQIFFGQRLDGRLTRFDITIDVHMP